MYYPKKFNKNDTIRIIAPSDGIKEKDIDLLNISIDFLKNKGYIIKEDSNVRGSKKGVSADLNERAKRLNEAFKGSDDLLLACTGGNFCLDILDLVDFELLNKNVKWVQGYSDITILLFYITTKYDIATMYSCNCKTYSKHTDLPTKMIDNNFDLLNHKNVVQYDFQKIINDKKTSVSKWECINDFRSIKGRIIGGCLECLKDIIGTKYDYTKEFLKKYKKDGIIWYFDISSFSNEDIFRTMWQFKNAGWFDNTKGIILGRLCEEITHTDISLKEALLNSIGSLDIPIIINADIGHTSPKISIVNGAIVEINKKDKFSIITYYI